MSAPGPAFDEAWAASRGQPTNGEEAARKIAVAFYEAGRRDAGRPGRVHIAAICRNSHDCGGVQPLLFDAPDETWGGMLAFVREQGWRVDVDGGRVVEALCPACAKAAG